MNKKETPSEILTSLKGKELTDVNIEEYADRLREARKRTKGSRVDRSAKIVSLNDIKKDEIKTDEIKTDENKDKSNNKEKKMNIKGTNMKEDYVAKIGAFVFFGIFGAVQIWLIIDWVIKECKLYTLGLHLLPTILVASLFIISLIIDILNGVKKRKDRNKKQEIVSRLNRSDKKGGKHK